MGKRRRYSLIAILGGGTETAEFIVRGPLSEMKENISVCLCEPLENGKKDWLKPIDQDITNGFMKMINKFMISVMNRRIREYDSTQLMIKLAEKMPADKLEKLLLELK